MLHIKCAHCGTDLQGQEVAVETYYAYTNGIKYKDYATTCTKCGGAVSWDKYVQKAEENKVKAIKKFSKKTGKSVAKIKAETQYGDIMCKVIKASGIGKKSAVSYKAVNNQINKLPPDKKNIVLAEEDKFDMALLKKSNKHTNHISDKSILLFTQSIIELAIVEKDEDFFMSNYGKQVVDTYNAALTMHAKHNYEITAELLLEKMRKGTINLNIEEYRVRI